MNTFIEIGFATSLLALLIAIGYLYSTISYYDLFDHYDYYEDAEAWW